MWIVLKIDYRIGFLQRLPQYIKRKLFQTMINLPAILVKKLTNIIIILNLMPIVIVFFKTDGNFLKNLLKR